MQNTKCPQCQNKYTKLHPAYQLINCDHSLCKKCLITLNQCAVCRQDIGMDEYQLSEYQIIKFNDMKNTNKPKQQVKVEEKESDGDYEEGMENYDQQCLLHSKPADLICLEDHDIICCNCALFGEHKGHQVINSEGILTKMTNYIEECLCVYESLKVSQKQFNSTVHTENYMHILDSEKEKNKNLIDGKFNKLISLIEIQHRKTLMKLQTIYKNKQQNLQKSLNFEQINQKSTRWYNQIEKLGDMMESTKDLQKLSKCLPFIDNSGKGEKILSDGEKMLQQILKMKSKAQQVYRVEQNVGILAKFDQSFINKIENFCKISTSSKQKIIQNKTEGNQIFVPDHELKIKKIPSQINKGMIESQLIPSESECQNFYPSCISINKHEEMKQSVFTEENLLLQSVEQVHYNQRKSDTNISQHKQYEKNIYVNQEYQFNGQRIATEVYIDNIPMLSISDIKPMTNVSSYPSSDQSRFLSRDKELQDIINVNMNSGGGNLNALQIGLENQKKKKNGKLQHVAQKFKGILDDLKNDRAETIDLTGADLGDANIFTLCPFIKKSKKLKVLKLIKNKLTDDCMPELLVSLADSKITSLNLSQNLLTDKICQYLPDYNNPNMKTLTLTLNKINRRQAKTKIDSLGKRGINVIL